MGGLLPLPLTPAAPNAWDALSSSQLKSVHLLFSQINVGKLRPKEWKEGLRGSTVEWCGQNSNGGRWWQWWSGAGRDPQSQCLLGSLASRKGLLCELQPPVGTAPQSPSLAGPSLVRCLLADSRDLERAAGQTRELWRASASHCGHYSQTLPAAALPLGSPP